MLSLTHHYDGDWEASKGQLQEDLLHVETVVNHLVGETLDSQGSAISSTAADGVIQVATVTLYHHQIKTLRSNPITFGVAPGLQYLLQPRWASVRVNTTLGAYTGIGANSWINIHTLDWTSDTLSYLVNGNGSGRTQVTDLLGSAHRFTWPVPLFSSAFEFDSAWGSQVPLINNVAARNQPFQISMDNGGADLTGGHAANTMTVKVYFTYEEA